MLRWRTPFQATSNLIKRALILPWNIEKRCDEGSGGKIRGDFETAAVVDGAHPTQTDFPGIVWKTMYYVMC
jgi:hypothetical protein